MYDIVLQRKEINMKIIYAITTTYEMNNGFMIDIIENDETYHAWIYKKNMGVKDLMFGVRKEQQTKNEFINIVLNNLPEYEEAYLEQWERT